MTLAKFPEAPGYIQTLRCPGENRTLAYNANLVQNDVPVGAEFVPLQAVRIESPSHRDEIVCASVADPSVMKNDGARQRVLARVYRPSGNVTYGRYLDPLGVSTSHCTVYLTGVSQTGPGALPPKIRFDIRLASPNAREVLARVDYKPNGATGDYELGMIVNVAGPLGTQWEFWAQIDENLIAPVSGLKLDIQVHIDHIASHYTLTPGANATVVNGPWT